ncbi:MAG TPA: c-type cytochrome [Burkholderiales bacterium]|nr:c-type cytochrome [Burkholderiales bacterium]
MDRLKLAGCFALLFSLASCTQAPTRERAQSLIERGDYLVNGIMTCNHCHTPKDKAGNPVMARQFAGGAQRFDEVTFTASGSNITQDAETGIGKWSDSDIRRALIDGVRPNGTKLAFVMPYPLYKTLTARDLDAVVAYLRTVAPIRAKVTPPLYKSEQITYTYPGAEKPMNDNDLRDPVKRGLYLASLGHCMQCHAERHNDIPDYRSGAGKGGRMFKTPTGMARASNITSHPTKGIGAWSDGEIKRALTEGVSRDGRPLALTMATYAQYWKRLTDEDLNALVAWLRTLPPLE